MLIAFVLTSIVVALLALMLLDFVFQWRWTCRVFGWHNGKGERWFDGCSVHSTCTKCGQEVMQDSQGNWF